MLYINDISTILDYYERGMMTRSEAIMTIEWIDSTISREQLAKEIPQDWLDEIKAKCEECSMKAFRDSRIFIQSLCEGPNYNYESYTKARNERWWHGVRAWLQYFGIEYEEGVPQWK